MTNRFKLIAAVLGLVVAAGTVADASANTVVKTVTPHGIAHHRTIKVVAGGPHRFPIGARIVKHVRIVHRAPTFVKIVKVQPHKVLAAKVLGPKKVVRVTNGPFVKHAMNHRGVKVSVIR